RSKGSSRSYSAFRWVGLRCRISGRRAAALQRLAGLLGLLGALLLDFLDFVEEVVSLFLQASALGCGFDHVGLAAIQEIQIGHRVVVVGTDVDGFLKLRDAFVNQLAGLGDVIGADGRWKGITVLDLLVDVILVVGRAEFSVGAE